MVNETLRNVRTMRQVKSSLDLVRSQKPKTTNSLSKTKDEVEYLLSLTDQRAGQILAKERRRFAAQEAAIDRSRQQVLRSRERLAVTINKNQALTKLRHELQRARWEGRDPTPAKVEPSTPEQNLHQIELRY